MKRSRLGNYEKFWLFVQKDDVEGAKLFLAQLDKLEKAKIINSYSNEADDFDLGSEIDTSLTYVITNSKNEQMCLEWVKLLLQNGANPALAQKSGFCNTPLLAAIARRQWQVCEYLIEQYGPQYEDYLNRKSNLPGATNTPLTFLLKFDNVPFKIFSILLAKGAKIDETDHTGSTALHYAAYNAEQEILELFLSYNPKLDVRNSEGFAPYHLYLSHTKEYQEKIQEASSIRVLTEFNGLPRFYFFKGTELLTGYSLAINFLGEINGISENILNFVSSINDSNLDYKEPKNVETSFTFQKDKDYAISYSLGLDSIFRNKGLIITSTEMLKKLLDGSINPNAIDERIRLINQKKRSQEDMITKGNFTFVVIANEKNGADYSNLFLNDVYSFVFKGSQTINLFAALDLCKKLAITKNLSEIEVVLVELYSSNNHCLSIEQIQLLMLHLILVKLNLAVEQSIDKTELVTLRPINSIELKDLSCSDYEQQIADCLYNLIELRKNTSKTEQTVLSKFFRPANSNILMKIN